MLQEYDEGKRVYERLLIIQKKYLELNCLSMNGEVDENLMAVKSSMEKNMQNELSV